MLYRRIRRAIGIYKWYADVEFPDVTRARPVLKHRAAEFGGVLESCHPVIRGEARRLRACVRFKNYDAAYQFARTFETAEIYQVS